MNQSQIQNINKILNELPAIQANRDELWLLMSKLLTEPSQALQNVIR